MKSLPLLLEAGKTTSEVRERAPTPMNGGRRRLWDDMGRLGWWAQQGAKERSEQEEGEGEREKKRCWHGCRWPAFDVQVTGGIECD